MECTCALIIFRGKFTGMEKYKIGQIVNAVALRGEVKVYNYSDYKERYEELDKVIVGGKAYKIEKVRYHQEMVILKLEGINDRNAAEALKGIDVLITEEELRELPEDTFYIKDLIGLCVIDADSGHKIGKINDVLQNSAQDIYQITLNNGKEALIPVVSEFIKKVDIEGGEVTVRPIPGMIDEKGVSDED